MSRGHGAIQQDILDRLAKRPHDIPAVQLLANFYARNHELERTPSLYRSFRRAAGKLADEGEIKLYDLPIPTRADPEGYNSYRTFVCVAAADRDITHEDLQHAVIFNAFMMAK